MTPLDVFMLFIYIPASLGFYIWRYALCGYYNLKTYKQRVAHEPTVSIIVPVYNEGRTLFTQCVKSLLNADYPHKEIIVVDDGSKAGYSWVKKLGKLTFIRIPHGGKREALVAGILRAKGEIIITVDSDTTIPNGDAIRALVEPFHSKKIGAVSGNIKIHNNRENLLTRIIAARYFMAFELERAFEGAYNSVIVCSGPFSAYRKNLLMRGLKEFQNQQFLGVKCNYGDDRHMTNQILETHDIAYAKNAVAYTYAIPQFWAFVKQQLRWKKSFCRETWVMLKFLHKKNIMMKIEFALFWTVFMTSFIAKIVLFYAVFMHLPSAIYVFASILFFSALYYSYALYKDWRNNWYGILYGFIYEFIIVWLLFFALAGIRDQKWMTR